MQLFGSSRKGKHSSGHIADDKRAAYSEETELRELFASEKTEAESKTEPDITEIIQGVSSSVAQETTENVKGIVEGRKKSRKKKVWKIIGIVLLVLAVIGAGVYVAMEYFISPPDVNPDGPVSTLDPSVKHVENRKDGVYTFLVAGVDQISSNTDTIMIGSFDIVNHKLNVVSIPRDTLTNIQHEVKKANSAYHFAHYYANIEGSSYYGIDPVESMRKELVKSMLGFDVDMYVLVNLDACEDVVDTIGGVEFDVPIDMNYDSNNQNLHIHINKGLQTLNGEQFVHVMRFRKGYANADLGRIETQQKLLKALAVQMISLKNIPNVDDVITIVKDNMKTNMTSENMLFFIKEFLKLSKDDIEFMTMPQVGTGSIYGNSYVYVDIDAWLDMVNEYFNPWTTEVKVNNVDIITYVDGNFYYTDDETKLNGGKESFNKYSSDSAADAAQILKFTGNTEDKDVDNNDVTE